MSSVGKGVIGKIKTREWSGKTFYSFALKGQDGWYGTGTSPIPFNEGDSVQFSFHQKGNFLEATDLCSWDGSGASPAPAVASVSSSAKPYRKAGGGGGFRGGKSEEEKEYWAKKDAQQDVIQKRIEIQAARNAAIETVKTLLTAEALKLPAKQSDKYDVVVATVHELTAKFMEDTAARLFAPETPSTSKEEDGTVETTEEGDWD